MIANGTRSPIVDLVITTLSPEQAQEMITRGECDVVDVREAREWSRGHLPGARLVPFDRLRQAPKTSLPRDGVIFVCAAGVRSEAAAKVAEASGLARVYNLSGGTRNWVNHGLPLVRESA
jgi:rhodanese-related sulfurtransferase